MSYVDDDVFDEGSEAPSRTPRDRSRSRGNAPRRASSGGGGNSPLQQRGVKAAILLGLGLVIVLVLWTSIRGCQRDKLVNSYKSYLTAANAIGDDSKQIGDELRTLLDNKDYKAPGQVGEAIKQLAGRADALVARSRKLSPPDALAASNKTLITTLEYRRDGLNALPQAIDATLQGKDTTNQIATIAEPLQTLGASDVIFKRSFLGPTNVAIAKDKVKDVQVKESYFFPGNTYDMTSLEGAKKVLLSIRQSKPSSGSGSTTNPTGSKHGVAVQKVEALQGGQVKQLVRNGNPTTIPATADLSFNVYVEDSGDFVETNVQVKFTYITPLDSTGTTQTETVTTIQPGAANSQKVTFKAPSPVYFRDTSTIKVEVSQVPGETVTTNNSYSYPVKFEISG